MEKTWIKGYHIIKYVMGYKSLYENVIYYESMKTKEYHQDKLIVTTARRYISQPAELVDSYYGT